MGIRKRKWKLLYSGVCRAVGMIATVTSLVLRRGMGYVEMYRADVGACHS